VTWDSFGAGRMPQRKDEKVATLANYWTPPERDAGVGEAVACLASTYTFHASLLETELLPRFLGLRYDCTEREKVFRHEREDRLATVTAAVFVDATQVDGGQTTGQWLQVPVTVPGGCQHAKVTLLVWERLVRVIVSSANLTRTGYRKNREMAAALDFFDGQEGIPRESLSAVLDFFHELVAFSRMPPATRATLSEAITDVRSRTGDWNLVSQGTDRIPTVTFVPVLPARAGRLALGALPSVIASLGSRRATDITVMTPFVGDSPASVRKTLQALFEIPRTRQAIGHLVVGGRPSADDPSRTIVDLPIWFRDEWANAWRSEGSSLPVYAVPEHRAGEATAARPLHAKALLVQAEERTVLLMGSSNFSPHGLGIGIFNLEANLCFIARESDHVAALEGSLPVDWKNDLTEDVTWPDLPLPLAEDGASAAASVPPVFAWATFHDQQCKLTLGLNISEPFPPSWSILLPGDKVPLLRSEGFRAPPIEPRIELTLDGEYRVRRVTSLVVEWKDSSGATNQARLPTLVAFNDELLGPEQFRDLTSDGILDCLVSGRDPIDWAASLTDRANSQTSALLDPLKDIDTSAYLLYRTRRLGHALAVLSRRLLAAPRTRTAMRHRLENDQIGAVTFARAMTRDTKTCGEDMRSAAVFVLSELLLSLAHVGQRVDPNGKMGLRSLFRTAANTISDLRRSCDPEMRVTVGALARYVDEVTAKCTLLLGSAETEVSLAD
jgi:hypothetical protein